MRALIVNDGLLDKSSVDEADKLLNGPYTKGLWHYGEDKSPIVSYKAVDGVQYQSERIYRSQVNPELLSELVDVIINQKRKPLLSRREKVLQSTLEGMNYEMRTCKQFGI
jgi:hypothetical protein